MKLHNEQAPAAPNGSGSSQGLSLDRLANCFEASSRRWELIVYPLLLAFLLLAGYGFFLVYNLTRDVSSLAHNVAALTASIHQVSDDMRAVTQNMKTVATMARHMSAQMETLESMERSMNSIEQATHAMAANTEIMRYQMGALNHNVGLPMSRMNSFLPW